MFGSSRDGDGDTVCEEAEPVTQNSEGHPLIIEAAYIADYVKRISQRSLLTIIVTQVKPTKVRQLLFREPERQ